MSFWSAFGLVVLILLVLIWVIHHLYKNGRMPDGVFKDTYENMLNSGKRKYDDYFTDVIDLYERTIGYENDDTAKMAMKKALKKEEMYSKNESQGRLSKNKIGKAATNSFMIADLYRFNVAPNQETKEDVHVSQINAALFYNKALNRIVNNPIAIIQNQVLAKNSKNRDHELPPEFMIDRAEDFYEDYIAQITINNRLQTDNILAFQPNFDRIREVVRDARIRVSEGSPQKPNSKIDSIDNYYAEKSIPNDPQNVHDSQVGNDIKNKFNKILEKNKFDKTEYNKEGAFEDIRSEIMKYNFPTETHRERALLILHKFSEGHENTNLNTTEDQILINIWKRINSPDNEQQKDNLKASLFDAMADSMDIDNYGVYKEVCLSGRCNRALESLTLLDRDSEISKPIKTTEILRNEIFSKSHKIIQDELRKIPQDVADVYNGKISSASLELDKKVEDFENHVRNEIEKTIREDYADTKPHVLDQLIEDAKAGI